MLMPLLTRLFGATKKYFIITVCPELKPSTFGSLGVGYRAFRSGIRERADCGLQPVRSIIAQADFCRDLTVASKMAHPAPG
jgi:hypothetical protein